ncbi:ligand-binding sensor domain-containing protein [Neolewinella aurantiaca]|nr:two-component regulator propeller domain-containing protein [Neolewinella aurantiaca]
MIKSFIQLLVPAGLLLLVMFALAACNGQSEMSPPVISNEVKPKTTKPADFDPYFSPTASVSSEFGPKSITRNIIQDRNGDVWLATWEGIIRYDGTSFTNFTNKDRLRRYHVFSAMEDRDGKLWFGTIGAGGYRYDGTAFTNITTEDGLAHDKQLCLYQDRSGKIWIGTVGGISIYNGSSYRTISTKDGLPDNAANSILEDRSGKFWIASSGALCVYDGLTFSIVRVNDEKNRTTSDQNGEAFYNTRSVIEDKKGNVWFGGNGGLWRYRTDGELTQFATEFIGYIYEDTQGNIWTSSAAPGKPDEWRLSRYDANGLDGDPVKPAVILQRRDMFFGITEDKDGGIWLGSLNGVGRYDGEEFDWFREGE